MTVSRAVTAAAVAGAMVWVTAAPAQAQGSEVIARAAVPDEDVFWVGGRVDLAIDVLARDAWATVPKLPRIDVPGCLTVETESQGTRINETSGGASYTGQRFTLALFPQRAGQVTVPALPLTIRVNRFGAGGGVGRATATTGPVTFTVRNPPGLPPGMPLVTSSSFRLDQSWEPDGRTTFAVGDALKRTIAFEAEDVSGMAFPPVTFTAGPAAAIYPNEPIVDDSSNRGTLTGKRTDAATIVFQQAGSTEVPAVRLAWWNPRTEELRVVEAPALRLDVTGGAAASGADLSPPDASAPAAEPGWLMVALLAVFLGASTVLVVLRQRLTRTARAWRRRREASEAAYFRRFTATAKGGDPVDTVQALLTWLDRRQESPPPDAAPPRAPATLSGFAAASGDPELGREIESLQEAAFGAQREKSRWEGGASLAARAAEERKRLGRARHPGGHTRASRPFSPTSLGTLNP